MTVTPIHRTTRLGLVHASLTGAAVLGVLFLLCTATEAIADIPAARNFLSLFTVSSLAEPRAEVMAFAWSLLAGGLVGLLVSTFANVFGALDRRRK